MEPGYYQDYAEHWAWGSGSGVGGAQHENLTSYDTGQSPCSEDFLDAFSNDGVAPPLTDPTGIPQEEPAQECITVAPSSPERETPTAENIFGQKKKKRGGVAKGTLTRSTKGHAHAASASRPRRSRSHASSKHLRSRAHALETHASLSPSGSTRSPGLYGRNAPSTRRGRGRGPPVQEPSLSGHLPSRFPLARRRATQQQPAPASRPQTAESLRSRQSTSVLQRQNSDASCASRGRSADEMLRLTTRAIDAFRQYLLGPLDDEFPMEELVRLVTTTCHSFIHGHRLGSRGSSTHSDPGDGLDSSDSAISLNPIGAYVDNSLSGARTDRRREPTGISHSATERRPKREPWDRLEEKRLQVYTDEGMAWNSIFSKFPHRTEGAVRLRAHQLKKERESQG